MALGVIFTITGCVHDSAPSYHAMPPRLVVIEKVYEKGKGWTTCGTIMVFSNNSYSWTSPSGNPEFHGALPDRIAAKVIAASETQGPITHHPLGVGQMANHFLD